MNETIYWVNDDETLSEAITRAVMAETRTTIQNVQPLCESLDPDALDALFSNRAACGHITFEHAGYRIVAHSIGELRLIEVSEEDAPATPS